MPLSFHNIPGMMSGKHKRCTLNLSALVPANIQSHHLTSRQTHAHTPVSTPTSSQSHPWVRGSSHCVVRVLWLTKYTLPLSWRFSVDTNRREDHKPPCYIMLLFIALFDIPFFGLFYCITPLQFLIFLDILSVCVQDAIRGLKPLNPVSLSVSSRTDAGVHALSNSAHFDLQRKNNKPPFTEDILVNALNFHLRTEQIRWVKALQMSRIVP